MLGTMSRSARRAKSGTTNQARARRIETDPRWAAVRTRDASWDGKFYYSVATTGVFCRPSCGARSPRPENVAFHATATDAERAGYRPCKRCKPEQPALAELHADIVARLCRQIETADRDPTLAELASAAALSPHHLHRIFKAITGLTPKAYALAHRIKRVQHNLGAARSVTAAIYASGYGSSGRFYERSTRILGTTPRNYRDGGVSMRVRFALGECSLGAVLVAASDYGVCAIFLGEDANELVQQLEHRFPRAELLGGDRDFEAVIGKVVAFVDTPKLGLDLPLDVRGTSFQQRVWRALQEIPAGTTRTYAEVATELGVPRAVRAVAGACAANPVAVAIPCHRVVRTDGSLSGYRWGVERKRALLERERSS